MLSCGTKQKLVLWLMFSFPEGSPSFTDSCTVSIWLQSDKVIHDVDIAEITADSET